MSLIRLPAPVEGMNFSQSQYGLPVNFALSIVNGVCRNGVIMGRGGLGGVTGTSMASVGNAESKRWLHTFTKGELKHLLAVTAGADVYRLTDAVESLYSGSGTVTESNAVMFDGYLIYTLYPAAAPREWDGYNDAALSFTRPATGDWGALFSSDGAISNGDFASGSGWTTGTGWAIAAGVATGTATTASLSRTATLTANKRYEVTFTVSGYTGGTVRARFTGGTAVNGTGRTANGTYTETITALSGNNTFAMEGTVAFTGNIDNITVRQVLTLEDSDVTGFCVHKGRVWYWSRKSDEPCYTALQARGGTLTRFPLQYVAETGGNIVLIETLTMDGGGGPDDLLAFVMDTGECLIYQGSDPGDPTDWALVGRFRVPPPLNGKCVTRVGGDSLMLTKAGLIPLQNYIKAAFGQTQVDWLEKINPKIREIAPTDGRLYYSAANGFLLAQVDEYLFCMDVRTGGWAYWTLASENLWAVGNEAYSLRESRNVYAGGFSEVDGALYVLGYNANSYDELLQYNTGVTYPLGVKWGGQFIDGVQKQGHIKPYFEASGEGIAAVYIGYDNASLGVQFSVTYSGQPEFQTFTGNGVGTMVQCSFAADSTAVTDTEGWIKLVAVELSTEPAGKI